MNYLIDTHVFLWVLFDDEKLSNLAQKTIRDFGNRVYVSLITYWEISLKYAWGKLELQGVLPDELPAYANMLALETLNLSEKDVSTFYQFPRSQHKDPFDRFIVWQAIRHNLTLISKDKPISAYQRLGLQLLW